MAHDWALGGREGNVSCPTGKRGNRTLPTNAASAMSDPKQKFKLEVHNLKAAGSMGALILDQVLGPRMA